MVRKTLLILVVIFTMALGACQSPAATAETPADAPEEMMEAPTEEPMEEVMDDEMMEETPIDDERMEETPMEDEMMEDMTPITFVVRIENIAMTNALTVLAPGAYELNEHPVSFFTPGEPDRGLGLEALAEDGDPAVLVDSLNEMMGDGMMSFSAGVFNTPVGADTPGPAGPGAAYEFTVEAYAGQYLTFATMFVQSNDWFFAPGPDGIALFDEAGNPLSGDITDLIILWDAGTEVDQTPGEGADQAPRQSGPDTGEDENGEVEGVMWEDYGIRVTITPQQ